MMRRGALAVLVVLAVGGWVGGISFLTEPSGAGLGLTTAELPPWPLLDDYTVPGLLLVVLFGVLPLVAAGLLLRHHPAGWWATAAVGLLLVVWMLVQLTAIGLSLPPMQLGFLGLGVVLAAVGTVGVRGSAAGG